MKNNIASLMGALALLLIASTTARAEVVQNEKIDFTGFFTFVPCADGGAGEEVVFEGNLHILFTVTADKKGGFHVKSHFQPQGLSGVGSSTGDSYQATGVTQDHYNLKAGETYTSVNNFRMIGQGPGNNFLIHSTFHYTINAKGELTVEHDNSSVECK
jgi:hypothetical protein